MTPGRDREEPGGASTSVNAQQRPPGPDSAPGVRVWCYLIAQWHGGHEVTVVLKPLTCIGVARGGRTFAARLVLSLNASIIIDR